MWIFRKAPPHGTAEISMFDWTDMRIQKNKDGDEHIENIQALWDRRREMGN